LLGIILYGSAFFLYTVVLTQLPLNIAHPILTSGVIVIVALCSILIFREPFYWTTGIGMIFIIIGVIMITLRVL